MIIFKYNLKKYFRTVSTWVLTILILIVSIATTLLFSSLANNGHALGHQDFFNFQKEMVIATFASVTPFLVFITALFAAFKSVQLFRDEINEGSLLLVISKPISRKKLLIFKWLSLISIFFVFILPSIFVQMWIFLNYFHGHAIHMTIIAGLLGELFVVFIFFCLFSSIALIVSLRLGVKSVIGLSFAITILVVISGSIQQLTYHPQFGSAIASTDPNNDIDKVSKLWNIPSSTSSTTSTAPKMYIKTSDKKPIFNKLWPLDLKYQISQMSNLFLKDDTQNYGNGFNRLMRVKSSSSANFEQYKNTLFLGDDSQASGKFINQYFTDHNFKTSTIGAYLKPAMSDAQAYLNSVLSTYKPVDGKNHTAYTLPINLESFSTYDNAKYAKSAQLFNDVASDSSITDAIYNFKFDIRTERDPINGIPDLKDSQIIHYNANTIFNMLLNYNMSNAAAYMIVNKRVDFYNFRFTKQAIFSTSLQSLSIIKVNKTNIKKSPIHTIYNPWSSSHLYIRSLLQTYNDNKDPKSKLVIKSTDQLSAFDQYFYNVKYTNYINPYVLSTGYFIIAIGLLPLTYWLFSRSDFN